MLPRYWLPLLTTVVALEGTAFAQAPAPPPGETAPPKEEMQPPPSEPPKEPETAPEPPPPPPPPPPPMPPPTPPTPPAKPAEAPKLGDRAKLESGWTTLRLLRDKGLIGEADYESALKDIGSRFADSNTFSVSSVNLTLYGFAQGDFRFDTTQSCDDLCGNNQIARPGTLRGDNPRTNFGVRNSRIGFRIAAPEMHGIKPSGVLETDFIGAQAGTTEQAFYSNSVLRVRHAFVKLESPYVDLMFGQFWTPFAWSAAYLVASTQLPGLPGQIFQRTEQIRISKTFKSDDFTFEALVAALRPPQRDSGVPEGVAGFRFALNNWQTVHSLYMTATALTPASIAVTGDLRKFSPAQLAVPQKGNNSIVGGGIAVDAFIPIIPAKKGGDQGNSLALVGEYAYSEGMADSYTTLGAAGTLTAPFSNYVANINPGFLGYDLNGNLETIHWRTFMVGLEYYLPTFDSHLALFANYGHTQSTNAHRFNSNRSQVRDSENYYEVGIFGDPTLKTRLSFSTTYYEDIYADVDSTGSHTTAPNTCAQLSAFIFF